MYLHQQQVVYPQGLLLHEVLVLLGSVPPLQSLVADIDDYEIGNCLTSFSRLARAMAWLWDVMDREETVVDNVSILSNCNSKALTDFCKALMADSVFKSMDKLDEEVSRIYKGSNFTGGCLEIRLFYVRIAPCTVDAVPNHLILRHLRREMGVWLEMNGSRLPSSDAASITLRLDRADKDSSEVTYVSTDNVRVSGPVEFEVQEMKDVLILCGSLERVETPWNNGNGSENSSRTGWSMDCYTAASLVSGGSSFCNPKLGFCSPSIEVYIAGCCSGVPVILTKTIQVSPRKKALRQGMLDAIPEDEEIWKDQRSVNGLVLQRKTPVGERFPLSKFFSTSTMIHFARSTTLVSIDGFAILAMHFWEKWLCSTAPITISGASKGSSLWKGEDS
nr:uncharacterized protein At1g01500-like [Ipomoea trifida]